ncbi:hypothetical protein [Elizabethkingia anophelis]|uniref:hypothetical protein n=1 Tax=Elizabethkingia anophelis TaxID=1117645 RepID=UPI0004E412CA|nr:hypothetical protein [Elizabethkingia anophelis]KFC38274.1 hypothetical protein FF18_16090 [Elizabethkingia anophelis]MCT3789041.1 hypothetical protein [Elizabethkingia anophelis]MDV3500486.1 hypothetical protein [Elizabethkingia anophelis]PKR30979.1 hypothetical protein CWH99_09270 [Elizabethkingia anophelis]PKR35807.1 hypothetical protein CWI00_01315 [Elizabethkingia anophelis]
MKTKLLVLALLVWVATAWGQVTEVKVGGNYYFNGLSKDISSQMESKAKSYDQNLKEKIEGLLEGTSFKIKVTKIVDNEVFFIFGKFNDSDTEIIINDHMAKTQSVSDSASIVPKDNRSGNMSNKKKYPINYVYSLPLQTFQQNVLPLYNRVIYRVGAFTVPFKLRLSSFSFDANVNIGANLGFKFRWDRRVENGFALEPIVGFGIASIKLDNSNSQAEESTNISAFTITTGVLIHLTQRVNVGVTYGFDRISRNDQNNYHWKYNGKGWLGIGINVSFGNENDNTGATGGNK